MNFRYKKDKNNYLSFLSLSFCWTIDQQNPEIQPFKSAINILFLKVFVNSKRLMR